MTRLITWQADDGHGVEGTRLLLHGGGWRALGRMVRAGTGPADPAFTASYRLVAGDDGRVHRLAVTSATAGRERHLTLNRTDDGFWLLDTGAGGRRSDFDGAVDIDLAFSPMFNTLPIRRLGLHRGPGEPPLTDGVRRAAGADGGGRPAELPHAVAAGRGRASGRGVGGVRLGRRSRPSWWWTPTAVVVSYPGVASRIPDVASAAP